MSRSLMRGVLRSGVLRRASTGSSPAARQVTTVVLTGGPCGGKSSALEVLSDELSGRGVDVYSVPEVPTILLSGGCRSVQCDHILQPIALCWNLAPSHFPTSPPMFTFALFFLSPLAQVSRVGWRATAH